MACNHQPKTDSTCKEGGERKEEERGQGKREERREEWRKRERCMACSFPY